MMRVLAQDETTSVVVDEFVFPCVFPFSFGDSYADVQYHPDPITAGLDDTFTIIYIPLVEK